MNNVKGTEDFGTRKPSASRLWFLTISMEHVSKEVLIEKMSKWTYVAQGERSDSDNAYEHFHVFINNDTPIRFSTLKNKFPQAHIELVRNPPACYNYTIKLETRIIEPFSNGSPKPVSGNSFEDLSFQIIFGGKTVDDLIFENPRAALHEVNLRKVEAIYIKKNFLNKHKPIEVFYLWGKTGVGKSRYIRETYDSTDFYKYTDYSRGGWDLLGREPVLVLEEFDSKNVLPTDFLRWTDPEIIQLGARYANSYAFYNTVWVLSNKPWLKQYAEVQEGYPFQYQSLTRRFSKFYYMDLDDEGNSFLTDETVRIKNTVFK